MLETNEEIEFAQDEAIPVDGTDAGQQTADTSDTVEGLSQEDLAKMLSGQTFNPYQEIIDNFNDEELKKISDAIEDYKVSIQEHADKINALFEKGAEVKPQDITPDENDPRYLKLRNEVGPIIGILAQHGKIPEEVLNSLMEANEMHRKSFLRAAGMIIPTEEEHAQIVEMVDGGINNAVAQVAGFQFENCARTLWKARLDGMLSDVVYDEVHQRMNQVYSKHFDYLKYLDVDTKDLDAVFDEFKSVLGAYEPYLMVKSTSEE